MEIIMKFIKLAILKYHDVDEIQLTPIFLPAICWEKIWSKNNSYKSYFLYCKNWYKK